MLRPTKSCTPIPCSECGACSRRTCFRSDRKSTRLNSSHTVISYAVFCLKKKNPHVARHPSGSYIAVCDFPFGAVLLFPQPYSTPQKGAAVSDELRLIVASIRLATVYEPV